MKFWLLEISATWLALSIYASHWIPIEASDGVVLRDGAAKSLNKEIHKIWVELYIHLLPIFLTDLNSAAAPGFSPFDLSKPQRRARSTGALQALAEYEVSYRENEELSLLEPHQGMILSVYLGAEVYVDKVYELLEQVEFELGESVKHAVDHAYWPVLSDGVEPFPFIKDDQSYSLEDASFNRYWQWWFPLWQHSHGEERYKMNDKAFAGGSHGEVWKGRRKCSPSSNDSTCHEPLILKRMKVGKTVSLLEAGLREIFFGNVLEEADEVQQAALPIFTKYIDHFFREESSGLELWIVFRDAGKSLRSFLYTGVLVGDLVVYRNSWFWSNLRLSISNRPPRNDEVAVLQEDSENKDDNEQDRERTSESVQQPNHVGQRVIQKLLHQVLEAAAILHHHGIVHRDIKPSNILCTTEIDLAHVRSLTEEDSKSIHCVLGDFSSAYNDVVSRRLYTERPSRKEQTDEYAPPEAIFGYTYQRGQNGLSPAFDSWSIGIVALELLLGTPSVFTVDQRTRALLTHKLVKAGATAGEIEKAMYLAALSQFCIFNPSQGDWPLRSGDPLHNISMTKASCSLHDFKDALLARDPLGLGFDSSADSLLHLIWQLLAFDPEQRMRASDALLHPYFRDMQAETSSIPCKHNALESQMLDPRMDFDLSDNVDEFVCPKCKRSFQDWRSCQKHANARKHGRFCEYDKTSLPTCFNAHSMLPAHSLSGHCDIQGRRRVMEDFHAIRLSPTQQFYAIFDGHNGNFASKFVASFLYQEMVDRLPGEDTGVATWKDSVETSVKQAFVKTHEKLLDAASLTPHESMRQSGTTATVALVTNASVIVASIGDSRAVLSSRRRESDQQEGNDDNVLTAIQLTRDHVASDPHERRLVEERGGYVEAVNGLARVNGILAITRSLGDSRLASVVSREAHVVPFTRKELASLCGSTTSDSSEDMPPQPCFMIIASDGMWDTMTNQEAVDMVSQVISNGEGPWYETTVFQRAAEALTLEAYVRGSTDNIGVCVVALPWV